MTSPTLCHGFPIDLPKLLETRLLIQCNSGGGKSYCLRRVLEQTHGQVTQFVIDPEGEFSTLREKFDYVICSQHGGDALAHPKTAKLLARRLLELNVSAILDIYDLKAHERQRFVRLFLESLVNAPKKLWRPLIVVLDEAHVYCPESGKGRGEAGPAVIDLATRGRKRGQCLIAATQRLAKLNKDCAAECLNKLIGRTSNEDIKRAGEELMMAKPEYQQLRLLKPGQFHGYGPAIANEVRLFKVGCVQTTHPKVGQRLMTDPPAPSAKVTRVLKSLKDLPEESAEAERTTVDLKREIASLRRQLTVAQRQQPKPKVETITQIVERVPQKAGEEIAKHLRATRVQLERAEQSVGEMLKTPDKTNGAGKPKPARRIAPTAIADRVPQKPKSSRAAPESPVFGAGPPGHRVRYDYVTGPQQKVLDAIAWLESSGVMQPTKQSVAAMAGSKMSGTFANKLGGLRSAGLIDYPRPAHVTLTDAGWSLAKPPDDAATLDEIHERWLDTLSAPQGDILQHLIDIYPKSIDKGALALETGSTQSGTFANKLGRLRTIGAAEYPRPGRVRATDILFPAELAP